MRELVLILAVVAVTLTTRPHGTFYWTATGFLVAILMARLSLRWFTEGFTERDER